MKSSTGCMVWTWVGCLTRSLRQILPLPYCLPPRLLQHQVLPPRLLPLLLPQRHQRLPAQHLQERRMVLMKSSTGCMVWTWVGCLTRSLRQILPLPRCLPPRLPQCRLLPLLLPPPRLPQRRLLPLLLPQRHQRLPALHLQERRLVLMKSSTGCMVWTWVGCLTKSLRQILQDPLPRLPRHPLLPQHQPNRPKSPRQPRRPLLPVPLPQPRPPLPPRPPSRLSRRLSSSGPWGSRYLWLAQEAQEGRTGACWSPLSRKRPRMPRSVPPLQQMSRNRPGSCRPMFPAAPRAMATSALWSPSEQRGARRGTLLPSPTRYPTTRMASLAPFPLELWQCPTLPSHFLKKTLAVTTSLSSTACFMASSLWGSPQPLCPQYQQQPRHKQRQLLPPRHQQRQHPPLLLLPLLLPQRRLLPLLLQQRRLLPLLLPQRHQ